MKIDINNKEISKLHSLRCFLNSLLREYKHFKISPDGKKLIIFFEERFFEVGLLYNSCIGRFSFKNEIAYKSKPISFEEFVSLVLGELSQVYKTNPVALENFKNRVLSSQENVEDNLNNQTAHFAELFTGHECTFKEIEQSLFLGHSFHPHPKNRDGFSKEDSLLYSPEARGEFTLTWLLVKNEFLNKTNAEKFNDQEWSLKLFLEDLNESTIREGYSPLPVHPWQMKHLLNHPEIINHIKNENIILVSQKKEASLWTATSSLRSIYNKESDYMLKFSMSVRLTNSVRHLLPHEVVRGIQVYDVFASEKMQSFKDAHARFDVIFEPAFMAILDSKKEIINESIVSLRENVFKTSNEKNKYVLAALLQDHPVAEVSLLVALLKSRALRTNESLESLGRAWIDLFIDYAVIPLMDAQANYGVMLGAHQQNLIIELTDALPSHAYFRDCQGTGYSELGFSNFSGEVKTLVRDNGNVLDSKSGSSLFSYYLFINSVFNVISSIARDTEVAEVQYFKILKKKLIDFKNTNVVDGSCIDYLLESEFLLQKGNFLCSIIDLNENTTTNPLGIYNEMLNPLKDI